MKKLLCVILIFFCLGLKAQSTFSISGTVTDKKGETLPGVTVYIANSRYATATNNDGKFTFDGILPGSYEIVVKMLGFNPFIQSIIINDKAVNISAVLTESNTTLRTVNITAPSKFLRAAYLKLFLKNFIGQTDNAQQCQLLNPDVLNLSFNKETFIYKASATDFLIIENDALGYKIKYLLTEYTVDVKAGTCIIGGAPYFEELKGTPKQQKQWEKNRRLAYVSSDRHFFRMVMNNTTVKEAKKEGFWIFKAPYTTGNSQVKKQQRIEVNPSERSVKKNGTIKVYQVAIDTTFIKNADGLKTLISKPKIPGNDTSRDAYLIIYTKEYESPLFSKTGTPLEYVSSDFSKKRQISRIYPLADTVTIDKNGSAIPALGFRYDGYWGWLQLADLTPLDYFVEPEK